MNKNQDIQLNKEGIDISALADNTPEEEVEDDAHAHQDEEQEPEEQQEPLSPEEVIKRRHLVLKLRAYVTKFPKHFKGIDWREFQYYDLERLEATMDEFKYLVGTSTGASVVHMVANMGFGAIEKLSRFTPLKLDGFCNIITQDEAIQDIINEISIEYGCGLEYVAPEKRLMFSLAKIAIATHAMNQAKEKSDGEELAKKLAKETTAEIIEKSHDL